VVEVELTFQMDQETLAVLGVEVVIMLRVEMEILHLQVLHKEIQEDLLVVRDQCIQQQVVAVVALQKQEIQMVVGLVVMEYQQKLQDQQWQELEEVVEDMIILQQFPEALVEEVVVKMEMETLVTLIVVVVEAAVGIIQEEMVVAE
jgi:hypothetical protein